MLVFLTYLMIEHEIELGQFECMLIVFLTYLSEGEIIARCIYTTSVTSMMIHEYLILGL